MTSTEALVTGARLLPRHPVSNDRDEFISIREASREFHLPWEPIPEDGSDPIGAKAFGRFVAACDTPASQKHVRIWASGSECSPHERVTRRMASRCAWNALLRHGGRSVRRERPLQKYFPAVLDLDDLADTQLRNLVAVFTVVLVSSTPTLEW